MSADAPTVPLIRRAMTSDLPRASSKVCLAAPLPAFDLSCHVDRRTFTTPGYEKGTLAHEMPSTMVWTGTHVRMFSTSFDRPSKRLRRKNERFSLGRKRSRSLPRDAALTLLPPLGKFLR